MVRYPCGRCDGAVRPAGDDAGPEPAQGAAQGSIGVGPEGHGAGGGVDIACILEAMCRGLAMAQASRQLEGGAERDFEKSIEALWNQDKSPGARIRWLRRAMVLVSTSKIAATVIYDVVTCLRFVAELSDEHRAQLGKLLQANLHLFSSRQQRAVLVEIPLADAVAARGSASSSSYTAGGGTSMANLQKWRPKQG